MKKLILLPVILTLFAFSAQAQNAPKKLKLPCRFTCAEAISEFSAGVVVDALSQTRVEKAGGIESGLFRTKDNKLNKPLYFGVQAGLGIALVELRLHAHSNTDARIYEWMLRGLSYVHIGVAIHNYKLANSLSKGN